MSQSRRIKIGVMGSAADLGHPEARAELIEKGEALAVALAKRDCLLFTGATTGIVYLVGKAAHDAGTFHIGSHPVRHKVNTSNTTNYPSTHVMRSSIQVLV